ncbi:MAG: YbaB/EbfC family nucleoid-associated protein [Sulfurimonadaceae bacterium]|jgi:DNA-binding YbaB/EbfC family protein|nr:YbaB/EbfC family nucleoid-associated protein [Sulfurimonadaceae bacterium]
MFGNMGDMAKMLEGMQEQAQKLEAEMASKEFTVKTGGGMVKVTMNGKGEMTDVEIDDSLLEDKDSLQILLIAAVNDANKMVEDNKKSSAMGMLGGMSPFGS